MSVLDLGILIGSSSETRSFDDLGLCHARHAIGERGIHVTTRYFTPAQFDKIGSCRLLLINISELPALSDAAQSTLATFVNRGGSVMMTITPSAETFDAQLTVVNSYLEVFKLKLVTPDISLSAAENSTQEPLFNVFEPPRATNTYTLTTILDNPAANVNAFSATLRHKPNEDGLVETLDSVDIVSAIPFQTTAGDYAATGLDVAAPFTTPGTLNITFKGSGKCGRCENVLKANTKQNRWFCDVCRTGFSKGDRAYTCSDCDYDECLVCSPHEQVNRQEQLHSFNDKCRAVNALALAYISPRPTSMPTSKEKEETTLPPIRTDQSGHVLIVSGKWFNDDPSSLCASNRQFYLNFIALVTGTTAERVVSLPASTSSKSTARHGYCGVCPEFVSPTDVHKKCRECSQPYDGVSPSYSCSQHDWQVCHQCFEIKDEPVEDTYKTAAEKSALYIRRWKNIQYAKMLPLVAMKSVDAIDEEWQIHTAVAGDIIDIRREPAIAHVLFDVTPSVQSTTPFLHPTAAEFYNDPDFVTWNECVGRKDLVLLQQVLLTHLESSAVVHPCALKAYLYVSIPTFHLADPFLEPQLILSYTQSAHFIQLKTTHPTACSRLSRVFDVCKFGIGVYERDSIAFFECQYEQSLPALMKLYDYAHPFDLEGNRVWAEKSSADAEVASAWAECRGYGVMYWHYLLDIAVRNISDADNLRLVGAVCLLFPREIRFLKRYIDTTTPMDYAQVETIFFQGCHLPEYPNTITVASSASISRELCAVRAMVAHEIHGDADIQCAPALMLWLRVFSFDGRACERFASRALYNEPSPLFRKLAVNWLNRFNTTMPLGFSADSMRCKLLFKLNEKSAALLKGLHRTRPSV